MSRKRRSDDDLPHAPQELLHPLSLPAPRPPETIVLAEIPGLRGMAAYQLLRAILAHTADASAPAAPAAPAALRGLERELLAVGPHPLATPLALLAGYLADPESATPRDLAWACLCAAEGAGDAGAPETVLLFVQAAALASPRSARYAWLAGRLLFAQGHRRQAEAWFRRSYRVAVWTRDYEAQATALNALGMIYKDRGNLRRAETLYVRSAGVARRRRLPEVEAKACHNLFTIIANRGDHAGAEHCARSALDLYGTGHPKVPELVADVAHYWNQVGLHDRALAVFSYMALRFRDREGRLRILAGAARAAGGVGDRAYFRQILPEVHALVDANPADAVAAAALFECGLGAIALGDKAVALITLEGAMTIASACGAHDVSGQCEPALVAAQAMEPKEDDGVEVRFRAPLARDGLARALIDSLEHAPVLESEAEPERLLRPA